MGAAGTMGDHSVPSRGLAHRARYMSFRAEGGQDYTGPLFIKRTHIRRLLCAVLCFVGNAPSMPGSRLRSGETNSSLIFVRRVSLPTQTASEL